MELSKIRDQMTAAEVRQLVERLGGFAEVLGSADVPLRARFYEQVGLTGTYDPESLTLDIAIDLGIRDVEDSGAMQLRRSWKLS